MSPEKEEVVRYRVERAEAALGGAKMFVEVDDFLQCTNRLYYACFYVALAWLSATGRRASKHTGVRAFVNKELVKTGRLSTQAGTLYNDLFAQRQEVDYADLANVKEEDVQDWLPRVRAFIDRMKQIIEEDGGISL